MTSIRPRRRSSDESATTPRPSVLAVGGGHVTSSSRNPAGTTVSASEGATLDDVASPSLHSPSAPAPQPAPLCSDRLPISVGDGDSAISRTIRESPALWCRPWPPASQNCAGLFGDDFADDQRGVDTARGQPLDDVGNQVEARPTGSQADHLSVLVASRCGDLLVVGGCRRKSFHPASRAARRSARRRWSGRQAWLGDEQARGPTGNDAPTRRPAGVGPRATAAPATPLGARHSRAPHASPHPTRRCSAGPARAIVAGMMFSSLFGADAAGPAPPRASGSRLSPRSKSAMAPPRPRIDAQDRPGAPEGDYLVSVYRLTPTTTCSPDSMRPAARPSTRRVQPSTSRWRQPPPSPGSRRVRPRRFHQLGRARLDHLGAVEDVVVLEDVAFVGETCCMGSDHR